MPHFDHITYYRDYPCQIMMHERYVYKNINESGRCELLERRAWYNNGILAAHLIVKRGKWTHYERYDYKGHCLTCVDSRLGCLVHEGRQPRRDHHGGIMWKGGTISQGLLEFIERANPTGIWTRSTTQTKTKN